MNGRRMPRTSLLAWASAAALALPLAAGCGQESMAREAPSTSSSAATTPLPSVLVQRVEAAYRDAGSPTGQVPALDPDATCPLQIETVVAGRKSEPFGAGVSNIGLTGRRVVCEGSKPSTTFSVGHLDDPAEFAELESEAGPEEEAGNEQTGSTETVGSRRFTVVRTVYSTNDSHIDYEVTLTDPAQRAYAVLQVETTGYDRQTYSSAQAARDLAAMIESVA